MTDIRITRAQNLPETLVLTGFDTGNPNLACVLTLDEAVTLINNLSLIVWQMKDADGSG